MRKLYTGETVKLAFGREYTVAGEDKYNHVWLFDGEERVYVRSACDGRLRRADWHTLQTAMPPDWQRTFREARGEYLQQKIAEKRRS